MSSSHPVCTFCPQMCAPFTCGQFSEVSPIFVCAHLLPRRAPQSSCSALLPFAAIVLPDVHSGPRHGPSSSDGFHHPRCSPTSSCASPSLVQPLPTRFRLPKPSQPLLPRALPSPLSHPAVPLPSPRCAPFPPLPTHLPAPERRPPPTMLRAEARPGPCSRNAPRGLPPLFPPCLAQRLPPNLPLSPPVTSRTRSYTRPPRAREGADHFPSCSAGGLTLLHPFSSSLPSGKLQLPASSGRQRRRGRRPAPARQSLRANSVARIEDCSRAPSGLGVTRRTAAREAGERQVGPPTWGWETGGRRACPTLRAHGSAGSVGCRGAGVGDAQEAESAAEKGERRRRVAAGHGGASAGGRGPGRVDEDQSL